MYKYIFSDEIYTCGTFFYTSLIILNFTYNILLYLGILAFDFFVDHSALYILKYSVLG